MSPLFNQIVKKLDEGHFDEETTELLENLRSKGKLEEYVQTLEEPEKPRKKTTLFRKEAIQRPQTREEIEDEAPGEVEYDIPDDDTDDDDLQFSSDSDGWDNDDDQEYSDEEGSMYKFEFEDEDEY